MAYKQPSQFVNSLRVSSPNFKFLLILGKIVAMKYFIVTVVVNYYTLGSKLIYVFRVNSSLRWLFGAIFEYDCEAIDLDWPAHTLVILSVLLCLQSSPHGRCWLGLDKHSQLLTNKMQYRAWCLECHCAGTDKLHAACDGYSAGTDLSQHLL